MINFNDPLYKLIIKTQDKIDNVINPSLMSLSGISMIQKHYDKYALKSHQMPTGFDLINPTLSNIFNHLGQTKKEDFANNAVLDVIRGNSFNGILNYNWQNEFPHYLHKTSELSSLNNIVALAKNWQSNVDRLERLRNNFLNISGIQIFENNTVSDAIEVAIHLEIEKNDNNEVVAELLDETNSFFEKLKTINLDDSSEFYDVYDFFIAKIDSLRFKISSDVRNIFIGTISAIISGLFVLWIQQQFIVNSPSVIDNSIHTTNNVKKIVINNYYQPITMHEIEVGKIYSSNSIKDLKSDRSERSKTLFSIDAGTKIKVIKKYKTWLWVRVLERNEFPYGFIKNTDLYSLKH